MPNAKPKIRAMKEHRPMMRIDIEKAERLAREIRDQWTALYRLCREFMDTINSPFSQIAIHCRTEEGQPGYDFALSMNYLLQKEACALLHGSERAGDAVKTAVAVLRILKLQKRSSAAIGDSVQA
jgi:hypothetical protein